ncbi:hypothetical protein MMC24_005859 [Lignoscripta atroalba]|nr:hypothetical protein [Lignoscripta atroalba]
MTGTDASTDRKSVRIESKKHYNNDPFIFDVLHTPFGCSTWPALWLSDTSNWSINGEIDVIEAVNTATIGNQVTLHTSNDCKMNVFRKETGKALTTDYLNSTNDNAGCGVQGHDDTSGKVLNRNGGGVGLCNGMEWGSDGIRAWFFPQSSDPVDVSHGTSPDPSTWGAALADFAGTQLFDRPTLSKSQDNCKHPSVRSLLTQFLFARQLSQDMHPTLLPRSRRPSTTHTGSGKASRCIGQQARRLFIIYERPGLRAFMIRAWDGCAWVGCLRERRGTEEWALGPVFSLAKGREAKPQKCRAVLGNNVGRPV